MKWKKSVGSGGVDKDGFIINLNSSDKTHLEISMSLLSNPAKFKIDPYLQKIVKMETGTRISILEALWQYIKIHKLQDHENK
jgi:SWI/SNF-related matrix-associated actin-dependent regulator of chromatin subfamily D